MGRFSPPSLKLAYPLSVLPTHRVLKFQSWHVAVGFYRRSLERCARETIKAPLNGLIHPGRLWEGWLKQVRNIMAADKEVETDDVSPGSMVLETETQ